MARIRLERGPVVCERGELATTLWKRTKGLLGRAGMADDEGLWIPTSSIHMFGMRFAIDVVYADREGRVLKLVRGIRPWRASFCMGAMEPGPRGRYGRAGSPQAPEPVRHRD